MPGEDAVCGADGDGDPCCDEAEEEEDGGDEAGGNPGRARDHLANERTYLAWLRTGANV
ncbi:DUF202 domain-containing protein, partial [Modestobacter sp. DSM 44400]|uniref:DUF202 domain-containing protein n=1 Tax=Modestobacter sp. DSM 44400 TaxID=1550230 RepID=UPI0015875D6C